MFRAARREEDPTDDDRRAVQRAIAGRIAIAAAAGTAAALAPRAAAAASAASVGKATFLGWFAAGLGAGATVGAVVTATIVLGGRDESVVDPPPPAVTASVPAPRVVSPPRVPVEPVPEASATATPSKEKPAPSAPAAASAAPPLEVETRALGDVTRALRDGRPDEALRLLTEQERTFARGSLHEERAAARVFALCAAGRLAQARSARDRFLVAYPQSPSADRVRASCPP